VHTEWDPLEEVIVGTLVGGRVPTAGRDLFAVEFAERGSSDKIPSGPFPQHVIEETEAELEALCTELRRIGIEVRRPGARNHAATISTPDWQTDGFYDYCPRDVLLAIGQMIIETPMVLRSRFLEPFAYRALLLEYLTSGAKWLSAPKPQLHDEMYDPSAAPGERLGNLEPAFDAANVLRFGSDLLYLISDSGNELGCQWLQSVLGAAYTVHPCRNLYASTHVDSTIVPLRPGLVLLNPARVNESNLPDFLRNWDRIWCPELVDVGFTGDAPYCSVWIGMNLLVVNPGLVVADRRQKALIYELERHKIDVMPLQLTHSRTLGGSFHCVTLDVRRSGEFATYC
jgi:glycine amidinotransferase/scyllo-inosamine-4-phosphate amidinotransferase 1